LSDSACFQRLQDGQYSRIVGLYARRKDIKKMREYHQKIKDCNLRNDTGNLCFPSVLLDGAIF
jgi:hypothetical protein